MKKYLINSLIVLLILVLTFVGNGLSDILFGIFFEDRLGFSTGSGILLDFLIVLSLTFLFLTLFHKRIGVRGVIVSLSISLLILAVLISSGASIKYTIKIFPQYIAWILGLLSGYTLFKRDQNKIKHLLLLSLFPIIMSLGINSLWYHRIEYGNWTGETEEQKIANFELLNKAGEIINNDSLKGKIVLFDFWFISCGPCWVKFPDLQRIYEKYEDNSQVEIYAVNRPMRSDKPNALFSRIEEKGYTFPVLKGTQEVMDTLGIYKYPTVMIINQNGDMVFMGELEDAEKKLELMLDQ